MAVVRAVLWAVFVVAVVTSKPIDLNADADSSKSLESSESSSSEETRTNFGPSQSVLTETERMNEPIDPLLLPSSDPRPSSATLDTSALPNPEDPQTSTDTFQVLPEDPCQTALGVASPQAGCNTEGLQDPLDAGPVMSTKGTKVTSTFQGVPQDITPPLSLQVITPAPLSFSTDKSLTIPITSTLSGAPVCFTIQLTTPEPAPARGDSI